ncbi:hypothetical protein FACS189476_05670 [Spirochaetia bacterium]|nr:hypothetical protein FACS189476_05670 [Spirochaetia bacterium]
MEQSGRLRSDTVQDSIYNALRDSSINLNLAPRTYPKGNTVSADQEILLKV